MWNHFIEQFDDSNIHIFHYHCPCGYCLAVSKPPIYTVLTQLILYNNCIVTVLGSHWQCLPLALSTSFFVCTEKKRYHFTGGFV